MAIELGNVRLERVHRVATLERGAFIHHRLPGLEGDVVQDLGRDAVRLSIEGIYYGPGARHDLERLRQLHETRRPVDFLAELPGVATFAEVVLEDLETWQLAGEPDQFNFALTVAEHRPESADGDSALDDLDAAIHQEAAQFLELATTIDRIRLGSIPDVTNPLRPLGGALDRVVESTDGLATACADLGAILGVE